MKKYYAVVRGRRPGIYGQWAGKHGAQAQVNGYAKAVYKGFSSLAEARRWFQNQAGSEPILYGVQSTSNDEPKTLAAPPSGASPTASSEPIQIYTDGSSLGNPGPGGYAAVLISGKKRREVSGGYRRTTNNRMELMAAIKALQALKKSSRAVLFTDSRYLMNGITKGWALRWRSNGWMRNATQPAENADLWEILLGLLERHQVEFHWVRGHAGTPENERCDQLALQASQKKRLPADEGYEKRHSRGQ
ncbi:MAG: ribonuclease HI [Anaerolineales bacterium]|jgi:ribonuclease HI